MGRGKNLTHEQRVAGGKASQAGLARGGHPLARNNFWSVASREDRLRHARARSARAKAELACAYVVARSAPPP